MLIYSTNNGEVHLVFQWNFCSSIQFKPLDPKPYRHVYIKQYLLNSSDKPTVKAHLTWLVLGTAMGTE